MSHTCFPLCLLLLNGAASADQYVISTVAGGVPPPTPVPATRASIGSPARVAVDSAGNVYFTASECVFKVDSNGTMTRVAGNGREGFSGDGGPAINAQLSSPGGIAVDGLGNLLIADYYNYRIRRVTPGGIITTVAGGGALGDGSPATSAGLGGPLGITVDGQGNFFIADMPSDRVRKVSPNGIIDTLAGSLGGNLGDGGLAGGAQLRAPFGVAVDRQGNLFIADADNHRIRRVSPDGIITTVAGNGIQGYSGDGAAATAARLNTPADVAVDGHGNLFIVDGANYRIRKVSPDGIITTVAGDGIAGDSGDGGPATSARLEPDGIAADRLGNLFISDYYHYRIRRVSPDGVITTMAGNGTCCYSGDGDSAVSAQLSFPTGVAVDGQGNAFIADADNNRVRKVSPDGVITTVAGNGVQGYSGDGGLASSAQLNYPAGVALDGKGSLLIADFSNQRIRKVTAAGIITTVAGNGIAGFSGDGGPATSAQLHGPFGVAVDGQGNLFLSEALNNRVRKVSPEGTITTVAGNGKSGYSGDGGPAGNAALQEPNGLAVDGQGNLFIADSINSRIRKVSAAGTITTVAGNGGLDFAGDGGPAARAQLGEPSGVAVDGEGNLFVADTISARVRRVSPDGIITTVAGNGIRGYSGDGGPATIAQLDILYGIAVGGQGNVYVAVLGSAIRCLQPVNQSVLLSAVVDAASQSARPVSPGKIVVLYGAGLGPATLVQNHPVNGVYPSQLAGTAVYFNGTAAPILYTSATQVAAIVPYGITGMAAQVTVSYRGETSPPMTVPLAAAAPGLFTSNQTGAGQAAAVNVIDGSINTAVNPVKIGDYVSLFATGEGKTTPAGIDGRISSDSVLPQPDLQISAMIGGLPALVQYAGAAPDQVAGLMQVNVRVPSGVQPGGYVPVILVVDNTSTVDGAVWIAVKGY